MSGRLFAMAIPGVLWLAVFVGCVKNTAVEAPSTMPALSQQAMESEASPTALPVELTVEQAPSATESAPVMSAPEIPFTPSEPVRSDIGPLTLSVAAPLDGSMVSASAVEVRGNTRSGAVVSVNGELASVRADGSFALLLSLEDGPNLIQVIASDRTGTTLEIELVVILDR